MTERDQFVRDQVASMLQPGEQIRNIAYVLRAPGLLLQMIYIMVCFWLYFFQTTHFYAALTDRRLILLKTKSGFFRPQIKNLGVEEISLVGATKVTTGGIANNRSFTIHRADGSAQTLRIAPWAKLCEGQSRFMDDVTSTVQALPAGGAVGSLAAG